MPAHRQKYRARPAETPRDLAACLALRNQVFRSQDPRDDADAFDPICAHIMVERLEDRALVCCFRYLILDHADALDRAYSAQFYELSALKGFQGPLAEMGRFCMAKGATDPDILRVAWAAMARVVEERKVGLLFGCSSFQGTDAKQYYDTFAMLRDRHIGPTRWLPRIKAPRVFEFARRLGKTADPKVGLRRMPPLLRTYLLMGGWVSDHAVVDRDLGTLHVFTGVEVSAIPPARRRSLLVGTPG
ncbi:MAG: GNAT family N-acyltransferase [Pseudomonadota bacterium]